jgi:hypothetical protein
MNRQHSFFIFYLNLVFIKLYKRTLNLISNEKYVNLFNNNNNANLHT